MVVNIIKSVFTTQYDSNFALEPMYQCHHLPSRAWELTDAE